jgi:hypothetical protein
MLPGAFLEFCVCDILCLVCFRHRRRGLLRKALKEFKSDGNEGGTLQYLFQISAFRGLFQAPEKNKTPNDVANFCVEKFVSASDTCAFFPHKNFGFAPGINVSASDTRRVRPAFS